MKYPVSYFSEPKYLFVCDHETTGFNYWKNEILTTSFGLYNYSTLELLDEIELQFKPSNLRNFGGEEVHGISVSEAITFPEKRESTKKLLDFIEQVDSDHNAFCCHAPYVYGTYFDWAFMFVHFCKYGLEYRLRKKINKLESTTIYLRKLRDEGKIDFDKPKLNEICEMFGIELKHHDAKSDRLACLEIYKKARSL